MQRVGIRFAAIHSPTPKRPTGSRSWVSNQGRVSNGVSQSGLIERDCAIERASASERGGALLPPLYCWQLFASNPSCTKETASGIASSASINASTTPVTSVASTSNRIAVPPAVAHLRRHPAQWPPGASFEARRNPPAFHGFRRRGDMSAFAWGTGSGSSEGNRRYQRVTGAVGDLGRARQQ